MRKFLASFLCSLLFCSQAMACPCGCGSSDFMVLSPIERFKYRVSISKEFLPIFYDHKGSSKTNATEIETIDTLKFAAVFALYKRLSLSFQLPLKRNANFHESRYTLYDPSLNLMWPFFEKDLYDRFRLSFNVGTSVKYPLAPSVMDTDREMEVFSNGHWEFAPSFSSTLEYQNWAFLLKEVLVVRNNRKDQQGNLIEPALINKLSFGLSYTAFGLGQAMVLLDQDIRGFDRFAGIKDPGLVSRYTHSLVWSVSARVGDQKTLSFSYKHPFFFQKNTPFYHEISLSFSQSV